MGGLAVLIGAFGAHGLEDFLAKAGAPHELIVKRLGQFDVGARYHLVHAIALVALSSITTISHRSRIFVVTMMVSGIVLFSGSLYLLVVTNTPWLGAVTPFGGAAWIIAWVSLAAFPAVNAGGDSDVPGDVDGRP
jgi:uncharacterized membrane protein YgdD (TMEM256/DUF423 family)